MTHRLNICVLGSAASPHVVARARIFRDFGHEVTLITPVAGIGTGDLPSITIPVGPGPAGKIAHLISLARELGPIRANIFHIHYAAETVAWMAWLLCKRPLIVSVMGGDILFDEQGSLGPIGRWLTRRTVRSADLVTVKSAILRNVVRGFGVSDARIRTVIWGIESDLFHPRPEERRAVREEWGVPERVPLLYSPRLLQPLYNQNLMIEALAELPDAWLALSRFGADPAWERKLRELATERGVAERIVWVPGRPREAMPAAYSAADIVLSLASSDGFAQTVLEAMACQSAVLIPDLPVYRQTFVHGESAWFTSLDPASVASAIRTLKTDSALRSRIVEGGYAIARANDFTQQARLVEGEMFRLAGSNER